MPYEIKPKYPYLTALGTVVILGLIIYSGSDANQAAQRKTTTSTTAAAPPVILAPISKIVSSDFEEQYNVVKRNNGSAIDLSVRAGMVAEAYLQAHDETNYRKWKDIEDDHKKDAGLPK